MAAISKFSAQTFQTYFKVTYFCVGGALRPNENFSVNGTRTKISYDAVTLSLFCKLHRIAKSIRKLMI